MQYKQLIRMLKRGTLAGKKYIRTKELARLLNITPNHASKDLQRGFRMGLLSRVRVVDTKLGGWYYNYYLSKKGFNFVERKSKTREDHYIKMRYIGYVANYGGNAEKVLAIRHVVPELLHRILKNKRPEDINPEIDIVKAHTEIDSYMYNSELTQEDKLLNIDIVVQTEKLLNNLRV